MAEVDTLAFAGQTVLAMLSVFAVGVVWYSEYLFGAKWLSLTFRGKKFKDLKVPMMQKIIFCFLANLLQSLTVSLVVNTYNLILGPALSLAFAVSIFISFVEAPHYVFEEKELALYLINQGYNITSTVMATLMVCLMR